MAPRPSRPAKSHRLPGASTTQSTDSKATQQAQQAQTQSGKASDDGEDFDLNVSGSEDSGEELAQRRPAGSGATSKKVPTEPVDQHINDPAIREKKTTAQDIKFFYETYDKDNVACKECRSIRDADPSNWPPSRRFIYSKKTSNSSLRPHLEKYHVDQYIRLANERGWKIMLPGLLSQAKSQSAAPVSANKDEQPVQFDEHLFHKYLVNFIVADDQSLNVIECPEFRALLILLRNDLQAKIPHRTKLRELVVDAWRQYFQELKADLKKAAGRISFTIDIWSDMNLTPYLAITAHWIAKDGTSPLQMKTALIAFHRIHGGHDGKSLASTVLALLDRAEITVKTGHFTMDNASNNTTMMQELEVLLEARDIPFDAADRRIMCFAHVVDLSSGRVIRALADRAKAKKKVSNNTDSDSDSDSEPPPTDPIAHARKVVRVIRGSGMRRDAFEEVILNGNDKGWFKNTDGLAVKIPFLQLLRDVLTRWDSVYHMLNRLRELRHAVDYYLALPNNNDLAEHKIPSDLWRELQDIEMVLSIPHRVQQIMSKETTPILSGTIPAFELFMSKWERLFMDFPRVKPLVAPGLEWATKYYRKMDRTKAYIIAMLLNPSIRMSWIKQNWEEEYIEDAKEKILETVSCLHHSESEVLIWVEKMLEYRENATTEEEQPKASSSAAPQFMSLAEQYGMGDEMEIGSSGTDEQTIEQEYDSYVTAALSAKTVDILKFWDVNGSAFPTLLKMAMDYLPIQASSVPCERIFSSSAETNTKKRNRINPLLMETLQMLKFHLKKERLNFTASWITTEPHMLEDMPDGDLLMLLQGSAGNVQSDLDKVIKSIVECDL